MTLLEINLTDVLLETDPDDKVVVWAPVLREGPDGQLVGSRRKEIPLTDGVGSDEVVPGPLMVQVQCKAMSDARPREVVVPEEGPVTLTELLDGVGAFTYSPPVIGQVAQYRNEAIQAVVDAEAARDVTVQAAGTVAGAEVTITEARDQAVQSVTTTRDGAVTAVEDTRDSVVADVNLAGTQATTAIAGQVTAAEGHVTTAAGHATQTADDRRQTGEDRTATTQATSIAVSAAQSAESWATSMTDVALAESPPGSGLYLFGGQTITEDPANDGLYLIGA